MGNGFVINFIEVMVNAMHSGRSGSLRNLDVFSNKLRTWEYSHYVILFIFNTKSSFSCPRKENCSL